METIRKRYILTVDWPKEYDNGEKTYIPDVVEINNAIYKHFTHFQDDSGIDVVEVAE